MNEVFPGKQDTNNQMSACSNAAMSRYASDLKIGLRAGVNAQIELTPAFFLQPGLMIVSKGSAEENDQARVNVQYDEVPISLLHKSRLGNGKLVVGAGPYLALAIAGNYRYKDSVGDR